MHPCTPPLKELLRIEKELLCAESTAENMKKLEALELQIERVKAEIG